LHRRKEILAPLLGSLPHVRLSEHIEERGVAFFEAAAAKGMEGIMAKDSASPYREGLRTDEWLKIKTRLRQEAVIGGFTRPRGSRQALGALVLGVYEANELVYIGHTGGGFDAESLAAVRARLTPLVQKQCPFRDRPATNAPVQWVRPELVCEVVFQEWTHDGQMRQPIFVGLREDKPPRSVHREKPEPAQAAAEQPKREAADEASPARHSKATVRRTPSNVAAAQIDSPRITHPDKLYWPADGYTKGDLVEYYRTVAPMMLPYLRDRPQSLHRHPNGIERPGFYQKDVSKQPPAWVQTVEIPSESNGRHLRYVLCQDEASLLYLVNLGCIEINPWNSRVGTLDKPDYLVIDLDPEDTPFARVVETAQAVRKLLDRAGAVSYCKTSGKRGLHIFLPLAARYDYETAKHFAELVANLVHRWLPASTSVARSPALRPQRVYLDFLQNRRGQTLAAPYSARPVPGAMVSTPLRWAEVKRGLDPKEFTIRSLARRLDKVGDLWQDVLGPGIDVEECLSRLARVAGGKKGKEA
jgi:bifunctional non-homologous end joining protein LigD